MDAYDIFKKLTKGLKFKTNVLEKSKSNFLKPDTSNIKKEVFIKEEPYDEIETEPSDGELSAEIKSEDGSEESGNEGEELQLVEGVSLSKRKKKKKQKEKSEDLVKKLEIEEENRFRNVHNIRVVGRGVPPALADLSALATRYGVSPQLINTMHKCGYTEPTPVQRQALPCMLMKRQILACAPTGSGKTAAFLVPVIHTLTSTTSSGAPRALVLCPTRELAKQTYREAVRLTEGTQIRCSVLNKITDVKLKEREATFKKSDIVMTTPNRLCYLLNRDDVNISLDKVLWLVIDEADKLFEGSEGQESDFRQQMSRIVDACDSRERRVAMLSATHTPAIAKWARHHMRGLINITVGQRNAATNLVEQELLYCGNEAGKLLAFRQLVQRGLKPPVLVFVQSKERAKQLFKELIYDGINVDVIHADRTQTQRDNVVRSFRLGRIWVLICTELLGRGIDFCGVSLVVNYDFPPSAIAYIHRIGRAGRAGQKGKAITFFTQDDVSNLRSIAAVMKQSGCEVPSYMLNLQQTPDTRRKLAKRAPRREHIATVLPSRNKRHLDQENNKDENKEEGNKENFKKNKRRRVEKETKKKFSKKPEEHKNPHKKAKKFDKNSGKKVKTIGQKKAAVKTKHLKTKKNKT